MKKIIADVIEKITGIRPNNEFHATVLLEKKLKELGGEEYVGIFDDIPTLLDLIKVYDDEVEQYMTPEFMNALLFNTSGQRKRKAIDIKDVDCKKSLDSLLKSITSIHEDLDQKYNKNGFVILKNKRVVLSTRRWGILDTDVLTYSCETVFNPLKTVDELEAILPESLLDGKIYKSEKNENDSVVVKYLTIDEILTIFTDNKIVEELCSKIGSKKKN